MNTNGDLTHPIHMHGLMFHVLEIGSAADKLAGKMQTPYDYRANPYPAMKDTVAVPSFGYAKIRFRATNPGMTTSLLMKVPLWSVWNDKSKAIEQTGNVRAFLVIEIMPHKFDRVALNKRRELIKFVRVNLCCWELLRDVLWFLQAFCLHKILSGVMQSDDFLFQNNHS